MFFQIARTLRLFWKWILCFYLWVSAQDWIFKNPFVSLALLLLFEEVMKELDAFFVLGNVIWVQFFFFFFSSFLK